jgi:hypothetical protein
MVKDMILSILKDAYPTGLTAAQIKGKAFLRYQEHINPNTLTVTLVRFGKAKPGEQALVKCEGRVWTYIRDTGAATRTPEFALMTRRQTCRRMKTAIQVDRRSAGRHSPVRTLAQMERPFREGHRD